jgi:hypothetical protein
VFTFQRLKSQVWIDTKITPGQDWRNDIAQAIQQSVVVIFIVTPEAVKSKYCKEEIYYASKLKKQIIPIVLTDSFSHMNGGIKIILQRIQWIDFTKANEDESDFDQKFEVPLCLFFGCLWCVVLLSFILGARLLHKETDLMPLQFFSLRAGPEIKHQKN